VDVLAVGIVCVIKVKMSKIKEVWNEPDENY